MPRTACASSALISVPAMPPLEALRAWMAAHNVDVAYVPKPVSIAYLTGFHAEPYERLMALTVRPDRATLIVPALEHEKAAGHAAGRVEIVSWRDGEDAYELARGALEGCAEGGGEKEHLSLQAPGIMHARTAVRALIDRGPELRPLRRVQNPT